jgi:hypothetical protein
MVHLGSWFVPEGGASGFHDVYTEKQNASHFRKTRAFPDGGALPRGNYSTLDASPKR